MGFDYTSEPAATFSEFGTEEQVAAIFVQVVGISRNLLGSLRSSEMETPEAIELQIGAGNGFQDTDRAFRGLAFNIRPE